MLSEVSVSLRPLQTPVLNHSDHNIFSSNDGTRCEATGELWGIRNIHSFPYNKSACILEVRGLN